MGSKGEKCERLAVRTMEGVYSLVLFGGERQARSINVDKSVGQTNQGLPSDLKLKTEPDLSESREERLVAFSKEERNILDLMRRRGMALRT